MEFFDKLGKKASEAYRITADKTGKIAKETKLKLKIGDLKSKINDIYEEIGKKVYEKHIKKEEISIEKDLEEECTKIDVMSDEIESLLKQCLDLRDKKQCPKCYTQIEKDVKFCPNCGEKQEENEAKEVELLIDENNRNKQENNETNKDNQENIQNEEENIEDGNKDITKNEEKNDEEQSRENLEKTTTIEINPDAQDITDEEVKNAGADD